MAKYAAAVRKKEFDPYEHIPELKVIQYTSRDCGRNVFSDGCKYDRNQVTTILQTGLTSTEEMCRRCLPDHGEGIIHIFQPESADPSNINGKFKEYIESRP